MKMPDMKFAGFFDSDGPDFEKCGVKRRELYNDKMGKRTRFHD